MGLEWAAAGTRTDGLCVGVRPPSLQTLMKGPTLVPLPDKLFLATVGCNPPFAAFEVPPPRTFTFCMTWWFVSPLGALAFPAADSHDELSTDLQSHLGSIRASVIGQVPGSWCLAQVVVSEIPHSLPIHCNECVTVLTLG